MLVVLWCLRLQAKKDDSYGLVDIVDSEIVFCAQMKELLKRWAQKSIDVWEAEDHTSGMKDHGNSKVKGRISKS